MFPVVNENMLMRNSATDRFDTRALLMAVFVGGVYIITVPVYTERNCNCTWMCADDGCLIH